MPVEAIVRDVALPADKPLKRRIRPRKNFVPRAIPFQLFRHFSPERIHLIHRSRVLGGVILQSRAGNKPRGRRDLTPHIQ